MLRAGTVALLVAGSAWGRGAPAREEAAGEARARDLYRAGVVYYEQERYEKALDSFNEAYRLSPKPALLYNVAQCYDHLEDLDRAIEFGQRYLDKAPGATDWTAVAAWVRSLRKRQEERARAAAPPPQPAPGPKPAPEPRAPARPEAAVPATTATPGTPLTVSPSQADAPAAPPVPRPADPEPAGPWRPPAWSPWAALGVAVAGAAAGAFFGVRVLQIERDGDESAALGATVSFAVAGVAAASAAGLFTWRWRTGDHAGIAATVSSAGGALSVRF